MTDQNRVAIVTGGSRGIGRGVVSELASLGFSIIVNYRADRDAAESAAREAEERGAPRAVIARVDVANLEAGRVLCDTAIAEFGRVDLLVNNAGVAPLARLDLLNTTAETWDRVLGINLRGPFFLTQAVAATMVDQVRSGVVASPQILFVTSISSSFASVNRGEYCVSKAGLSMVAQLFATRLAEEGIRVNEIRPGIIATEMTEGVREIYDRRIGEGLVPVRRWGTPSDVGRAVAALAADSFPYTTGEVFHVDGGLHLRRL